MGTQTDETAAERIAALEHALAEKDREIAELRREKSRFQMMIAEVPVGIWQDDGEDNCIYVNEAWSAITGMTLEQARNTGWLPLFHPEDVPRLAATFGEAKATGKQFSADYRIVRPSGEVRWVHGQSAALVTPEGQFLGYVGTLIDITSRHETQSSLQDRHAELEQTVALRMEALRKATHEVRIVGALLEHSADAILLSSPEGDVRHVNPAYHKLFGTGEEVIGTPLVDAMRPADEESRASLYAALVDGNAYRGAVMLRAAGEQLVPAQVDCYVVREGPDEVLGLAALIRDLTEDKRAEEERATLEAKVIASQEALIRELSTPLLPIARGVIVLPLVGSINDTRAQQIMETLLAGIQEHQATSAILDITGVPMVDTHAANAIVSAASAAKLLGTNVILSGIGPAVARTLVELGAELGTIATKGTLATAIAHATRSSGKTKPSA